MIRSIIRILYELLFWCWRWTLQLFLLLLLYCVGNILCCGYWRFSFCEIYRRTLCRMVVAINWLAWCQHCRRAVFWTPYCSSCAARSCFPYWKTMWMTSLYYLLCHRQVLELQLQSPWTLTSARLASSGVTFGGSNWMRVRLRLW